MIIYLLYIFLIIVTVRVFPSGPVISVPGGDATFSCTSHSHTITRVYWLVNGTHLEELHLMNVTEVFDTVGNGVGTLKLKNLPVGYNTTTISCDATLSSERSLIRSNNYVLLLIFQGI